MREQAADGGSGGTVKLDDLGGDEDLGDDMTDAVGMAKPNYGTDSARELGERLYGLYQKRAKKASKSVLKEIREVQALMRKGPRLHPGEFISDGRYRLLDRLGHDAVDGRWQAWDSVADGPVHIKIMHGDWVLREDLVDDFVARANKLAEWDHRGIAQIIDSGRSAEGFVFLATEFMGPVDLHSAIVAETPLSDIAAIQAMLEVAEALDGAHSHHVVHGAVTPSNVVIAFDGAAHLTNFDLQDAKLAGAMGNLYNAPETLERQYVRSPKADVYSWGMTTIFALYRQELPFWVLRDAGRLIDSLDVSATMQDLLRDATEWDLDARLSDTASILVRVFADEALVRRLANHAFETGRFAIAAGHYDRLLKLDVDDCVALHMRLGDIYTRMKAWDQSIEHLGLALGLAIESNSEVVAQAAAEPLFELLYVWAGVTGDWSKLARMIWDLARKNQGARRAFLRAELARINQEELRDPIAAAETWQQVLEDHHTVELGRRALVALRQLAADRKDWTDYVETSTALLPYLPEDERPEVEYAIGRAFLNHVRDEDHALLWLNRAEQHGRATTELAPKLEEIFARRGDWPRVIELMLAQAAGQKDSAASRTLLRAGLIAQSVHLEDLAIDVYDGLLERVPDHTVALRNLARIRHRGPDRQAAMHVFNRLCKSYGKRKVVEPESSERAGDLTAFAMLLLSENRVDEGVARLREALKLNGNLVPALEVAGPLFLVMGEVEDAGKFYERLHTLFRSVDRSASKIDACLGMGDIAWLQGRLTEALGWFNKALEADNLSPLAWWGIAKCAIAARGGHPGADRAPWLCSIPPRFTPQETLARLFMGIFDSAALRSWLQNTGMGAQIVAGGETPARLACGVVDVMQRHNLVDPDLFARLSSVYPDWRGPIEMVQGLWYGTGAEFDAQSSYAWAARGVESDFDRSVRRTLLPLVSTSSPMRDLKLLEEHSWSLIMGGMAPPPPNFDIPLDEPLLLDDLAGVRVATLSRAEGVVLSMPRAMQSATVGSAADATWRLDGSKPLHVKLSRVGPHVYIEAEAPTLVNGEPAERRRLRGGETVAINEVEVTFALVDAAHEEALASGPPVATAPAADGAPVTDVTEPSGPSSKAAVPGGDGGLEDESDTVISQPVVPVGQGNPAKQHADTILSAMKRNTPAPSPDRATALDGATKSAPESVASSSEAAESVASVPESVASAPEAVASVPEAVASDPETGEAADPGPEALNDADDAPESEDLSLGSTDDLFSPPMMVEEEDGEANAPTDASPEVDEPAGVDHEAPSAEASASVERSISADSQSMDPPAVESSGSAHTLVPPQSLFMPINLDAPPPVKPPVVPVTQTARAVIEFMSGPSRGITTEIDTVITIGSGAVDLQITGDPRIEAEHCTISRRGSDEFAVTDGGTAVGTFVNGAPITTTALQGGEVIMVGRTVLRFRLL